MTASTINVDVPLTKPLTRQTTMNVHIILTRRAKFRLWLGLGLIRLGVKALGCGLNVETSEP